MASPAAERCSRIAKRAEMLAARTAWLVALRSAQRGPTSASRSCCSTFRTECRQRQVPRPISRVYRIAVHNTLKRDEGRPAIRSTCPTALRRCGHLHARGQRRPSIRGALANVAARISRGRSCAARALPRRTSRRQWGPAPGRVQSDGAGHPSCYGLRHLGNVFIGVQPGLRLGRRPDAPAVRARTSRRRTPSPPSIAGSCGRIFGAHAVLHCRHARGVGIHAGQADRSCPAACWPDRLIADLPNVNLYASNNPSEGIARQAPGGARR